MECPKCKEYFTRRDNYKRHLRSNCPKRDSSVNKHAQSLSSPDSVEGSRKPNFKKLKLEQLTPSKDSSSSDDENESIESKSKNDEAEIVDESLKEDDDESPYYSCEEEDNDLVDGWYNLLQRMKFHEPLKSFTSFKDSIFFLVITLQSTMKTLRCSRIYRVIRKQSHQLKDQGMLLDEIFVSLKHSLKPAFQQFFMKIKNMHEDQNSSDNDENEMDAKRYESLEDEKSNKDEVSSDDDDDDDEFAVSNLNLNKELENQKVLETSMWRSLLSVLKPLDPFNNLEEFMEALLLVSLILPKHLSYFKNDRIYKIIDAQANQLRGLEEDQVIETLKVSLVPFLLHHYKRMKKDL